MAENNCLDNLIKDAPQIHAYLREKTGIELNLETGEGKQQYIDAATELRNSSINELHNVYAGLGIKGFDRKEISAKPVAEKINPEDQISVGEMIDKVGSYKGQKGRFFQDGQTVVFKVDGQPKEYELGNADEIKDAPISSYGITNEQSVVSINDVGAVVVRGESYTNNFSDPVSAINYDKSGNIVSVNLETAEGKKRTFRGNVAEDIAYQIHLKEISNNDENTRQFEQFINTDEDAEKEMVNAGLSQPVQTAAVETNAPVSREKIEPAKPAAVVEPAPKANEQKQTPSIPLQTETKVTEPEKTGQAGETAAAKNEPKAPVIPEKAKSKLAAFKERRQQAQSEAAPEVGSNKVFNVPVSDISTNEKEYQGRKNKFSERSAQNVAQNFDENKFDPVVLYKHSDGKTYILSGHSRLEGKKRRGDKTIPARYFEGTPEQAQEFAQKSNKLGSLQTDIENAAYYREKLNKGASYDSVLKEAKENEQEGSAKRIVSLANLNPSGKAMEALEQLDKGEGDTKANILTIASKIGDIRAKNEHLTNAHENELFDFMVSDKDNIPTDKEIIDQKNTLNRSINAVRFDATEPLNLEKVVIKSENRIAWEKELKDLELQQAELKKLVNPDKKSGWTGLKDNAINSLAGNDRSKKAIDQAVEEFDANKDGIKDAYQKQLSIKKAELQSVSDKIGAHLLKEKSLIEGDKAQQRLFATKGTTPLEVSEMTDIVKDIVESGVTKLSDIKKLVAAELEDDSEQTADIVELAYNEYGKRGAQNATEKRVTEGVIGKVGQYISRLFGGKPNEKVQVLKNSKEILDKASELGTNVKFQVNTKVAQLELDKAKRELKKAEDKISSKQTTQAGLFGTAAQADMFGINRDEAKSILDPLRQKVREAQNNLVEAEKNQPKTPGQNLSLFMNDNGDILGFTHNNKVYLNGEQLNPNTPIHEAGHIWTEWAQQNDQKVYSRGIELVQNSKYLIAVKNNPFYKGQAALLPSNQREKYFAHEALAAAIGDKGAQFVTEARKSSFKEWLKNLWNNVKEAMGFTGITADQLQNLTFDEFASRAARDILAGEAAPKVTAAKEDEIKMRLVYKNIIERSQLTQKQKDILRDDPEALYTVLPNETAKQIALDLIEEMGVENAVAEASRKYSGLEPVERVMILGAAMDYYAGLGKAAAAKGITKGVMHNADLELDANEKMQEAARQLGGLGTSYGRAINIFNEVYKLSNLALERKLQKTVNEINKLRNPAADESAKVVSAIITDDKLAIRGVGTQMTDEEIEAQNDLKKRVSDLEKEVEDLRNQIKNVTNTKTGTKANPIKFNRVTNATEYDKRLKDFQQRQRTGISKDDLNDLSYFGLYHLENGLTKFADWYAEMSKRFKKFTQYLRDIYFNVRDESIDNGADKTLFDAEDVVDAHIQQLKLDSDARKVVAASKRLADAKVRQAKENEPDKARIAAPRYAAERIRRDAEKNLDLNTTVVEQTYLKRLIQVVQNKAKEYYKEKNQKVGNVNDWLQFAIANGKADYAIWERTQAAVEAQIDEDEKLSDDEKEQVKEFLSDYQESIFDTLLTKGQKAEIIRQKLIENGYVTERTINGKVVKAVDWDKVIGSAKNIKEAKAAIVKSITDLGYTQQEAANEINSILNDFDNKVTEKKTKAINSYLNKGALNKVKAALGSTRKGKVQKLIDMNNKGVLNDSRVKDVLAKDLGIISLTEDDLQKVRDLSEKIDKATVPFIKKKYEEQMQYIFDSKSGNLTYLENREFVMNNRLTSLWNNIQNLTGYFRILSTYMTIAIKTGSPIQSAKIFRREWKSGVSDALTILTGGHVSRGTAFSDLTRSTEGEPRVRYLEQGKGKLLGLPDLYVRLGKRDFQVNPINELYRKIKYVARILESADTIPSNVISGLTQYWQIRKQLQLLNPELSSKQLEQKTYETMYGIEVEAAKKEALASLIESGVATPTKFELNRASHEIVERKRNEILSKQFYDTIDNLKPTAEQKLIQQGNTNPTTEEITKEAYAILGRDEPLDIVARGERQALRETGKKTTAGISALVLMPIDRFQRGLKRNMLEKHGQAGKWAYNVTDAAFNQLLPFANSIGRWIEMGLELTPYGVVKGLGYKGYGAFTKKTDNKKLSPVELSELGDDYIIRGIQGTAQTMLAMYLIGMLKGSGDDDEDKITGQYKGGAFPLQRIKSIGHPQRSLDIAGHKFPLDLVGNAAYPIMMYSDFLDRRTDDNERHGVLYTTAALYLNTAAQSSFSRLNQYGTIIEAIQSGKPEKYLPALGRLTGNYLGAQFIPFNRFQQEVGELWNPKSTQSITFGENLLQQFSIIGGLIKDHPAFDYRGREYDKGDIWVGSPDGIVKMFTKSKTADEIDKHLAQIDFAATDAYRETKDEENYKYTIENTDGSRRFMTTEEYYNFKRQTGNEFNTKLAQNFELIKDILIVKPDGELDEAETRQVQRDTYSELLTKSKENALAVIQANTGHLANIEQIKKERKEENKFILKQKKQQLQLLQNE